MAVEASSKLNLVRAMDDDDDDGPVVFKRNTTSKPSQVNQDVKKPSSSSSVNGQNVNAQKSKTAVPSSRAPPVKSPPVKSPPVKSLPVKSPSLKSPPVKSPPVSLKPSTSSVKSSPVGSPPLKSPVTGSRASSPLDDRLKRSPQVNTPAAVKEEVSPIKNSNGPNNGDADSDPDDYKPLSFRLKGNTSNADKEHVAPKRQAPALPKVTVKSNEDSDDEVPLSTKFSKSAGGGTSGGKSVDVDEKKPLANGGFSKQQKPSAVPLKRPLDNNASSSTLSSTKKHKVLGTSSETKVKQVTVKAEQKADDEDHIPIGQRMKKILSSDNKSSVTKSAKVVKGVSSTSKKINKKSKKVVKNSKYSKSTKMLPSAGDGQSKWTTLAHNGVIFPPPYTPHGVKMLYKGKQVDLTPAQEEVLLFLFGFSFAFVLYSFKFITILHQ